MKALSLAATTAMLAVVLLASCHFKKEVTATTKEQYDIESAGSSSIATTSRSQWLSRLSLDIDSFEVVIPTRHFAEVGKMAGDTAMDLPEQFALSASQPALGCPARQTRSIGQSRHRSARRYASHFTG